RRSDRRAGRSDPELSLAWEGDLLRRQGLRSREPGRLSRQSGDQTGLFMSERITTLIEMPAAAAGSGERIQAALRDLAHSLRNALPAVFALGLLLGIWELACRGKGAALPP